MCSSRQVRSPKSHNGTKVTRKPWPPVHGPPQWALFVDFVRGPLNGLSRKITKGMKTNKTTPNSYIAVIPYRGLEMRLIDKNSTLICVTSWIGTSDVSECLQTRRLGRLRLSGSNQGKQKWPTKVLNSALKFYSTHISMRFLSINLISQTQ